MSPYRIKVNWKGSQIDLECRVSNTDILEFDKELRLCMVVLDEEFIVDTYYVKGRDLSGYMILDKDFKFTGESYMTLEDCQKVVTSLFVNRKGYEVES